PTRKNEEFSKLKSTKIGPKTQRSRTRTRSAKPLKNKGLPFPRFQRHRGIRLREIRAGTGRFLRRSFTGFEARNDFHHFAVRGPKTAGAFSLLNRHRTEA